MLSYLVERTLAGDAGELKEYAVGVDVFDRGENYDPRLDSIVRVEAGRLRAKLDEYYSGESAKEGVRISLPRGGYVPQFERRKAPVLESGATAPTPARTNPRTARSLTLGAAAGAVLIVAALAGWRSQPDNLNNPPGGVTVAVLAFEHYSADPGSERLAAEIVDGVTSELARLGTIGVASHTSAMRFAGTRTPIAEIAEALHADLVLEGSITEDVEGLQVTVRLVDPIVDRKVWVESFQGNRVALRDLERRIAAGASVGALERRPAR